MTDSPQLDTHEEDGPWWGYETLFDLKGCSRASVIDQDHIKQFAKTLIDAINMEAYGEPQVVHFGVGPRSGNTLIALITTSNIVAHFCDGEVDSDGNTIVPSDGYLNIFSCKTYDVAVAEKVVREYFKPERVRVNYITRQA
jgi:S-adenosylmethionine/arginine decarboxylase-like enzyme